ncbi:MAG: D-glutamate cyclase family protein [Vulcanimicrobiaceae bacterium]
MSSDQTVQPVGAAEARALIRSKRHTGATGLLAPDFVQADLIAVPAEYADELRALCARNPVACPLLDVTPPGGVISRLAEGSDLRVDLPGYRVYRNGALSEKRDDAVDVWREDLVAFLLGSSYTFEQALARAGLQARHQDIGSNVPIYRTTIPLAPAGRLRGHMMVTMRPYQRSEIERVRAITRPYTEAHGEPFWVGDPRGIGIWNLATPNEGDAVPFETGEVPVFWASAVTAHRVVVESRLPFVITHEPGRLFITDLRHEDLARGGKVEFAARM